MTFGFIAAEKAHYPVRRLCAALDVSPSGFYAWAGRLPSARADDDRRLTQQLRLVHAESQRRYGRPRLHRALRQQGRKLPRSLNSRG